MNNQVPQRVAAQMTEQMQQARQEIEAKYAAQYFAYSMLFSAVASAAPATSQMQIQADSHFMVISTSFFAFDTVTNAQDAAPLATIQLTNTGAGASIFDQALPIMATFGTASLPFILPTPRILVANSVLTGSLTNGTTTNPETFYLVFHGSKLFRQ
jgi:hypothetical protein